MASPEGRGPHPGEARLLPVLFQKCDGFLVQHTTASIAFDGILLGATDVRAEDGVLCDDDEAPFDFSGWETLVPPHPGPAEIVQLVLCLATGGTCEVEDPPPVPDPFGVLDDIRGEICSEELVNCPP